MCKSITKLKLIFVSKLNSKVFGLQMKLSASFRYLKADLKSMKLNKC